MEAISYAVKPMANQDFEFVSKYISFIKSLNSFNISAIEDYISKEDNDIAKYIKSQNVSNSKSIEQKDCSWDCNQKKQVYSEETDILQDYEETGLLIEEEFKGGFDEDEGTSMLLEETTENSNSYNKKNNFPELLRVSTNENIVINKPVFRLGKERSYVDYFITNNNAISRSHADIITRGNRCFVCDQNSTNHTYINGNIVEVKTETEIYEGDILKLANEEFIFHM